jgi:hypothetical protein
MYMILDCCDGYAKPHRYFGIRQSILEESGNSPLPRRKMLEQAITRR